MMEPQLREALRQVLDLSGIDMDNEAPAWFVEPEELEKACPGLPAALYDLAAAFSEMM